MSSEATAGRYVRQAQIVNLAEQPVEAQPLPVKKGNSVELPVRGAQIVTLKVV